MVNICLGLRMCTGLDLRFSFVVDSCGLVRVRVLFGVIMTLCLRNLFVMSISGAGSKNSLGLVQV